MKSYHYLSFKNNTGVAGIGWGGRAKVSPL